VIEPSGSRRLGAAKPTSVMAADGGVPRTIAGASVDAIREEWVVEDRWWTGRPLRRRYFEGVVSAAGVGGPFRGARVRYRVDVRAPPP
jgi:hypothetical protein